MLDLTVNTDIWRMNAITEDEATLRSYLEASLRARFNASPCKPSAWHYYGLRAMPAISRTCRCFIIETLNSLNSSPTLPR
jgi:hypothetical protein